MMVSAGACSFCWIMIAIAQGRSEAGGDSYKLGIVAVSFFFVFFASFGMGVLGVPWLYPTEYVSACDAWRSPLTMLQDKRT
jgi:hypothetical protein